MMPQRLDAKGVLLGDLFAGVIECGDYGRTFINAVSMDSRDVSEHALFIARPGIRSHGLDYLDQALALGAVAVVAEPAGRWDRVRLTALATSLPVPVFMVSDLARVAGLIAARFFGHPAQALRVVGVTGTNGKTSITHFLAQALAVRVRCGLIGTLGNGFPNELQDATHTTPDVVAVHAELARQRDMAAKVVAMEVSSHALDQGRVSGVPFHTAVFSNLSRDHQDYHGSMEAYAEAKARLLRRQGLMLAVINADDAMGARLINEVSGRVNVVAVGMDDSMPVLADRFVHARKVVPDALGLQLSIESSWGNAELRSNLLGRFNAENLLLTLGVLLAWDMPMQTAISALESLQPVAGRMSVFGGGKHPKVVVDYAHTPDAMEKTLTSLREHVRDELICVFGCGGDRDQGKRPLMGAIAERLADRVLVTDDNPRSEDPEQIVEQILAGMRSPDAVHVERDRAKAIAQAVGTAGNNDLVLVAGKGHEAWQQIGQSRLPFSDVEQVRLALGEREA